MASKFTPAAPADVRAWATEVGLKVGKRGRFAPEVVEGFNKAHNGKGGPRLRYVEGAETEFRKVTYQNAKGRTVTRSVSLKAARQHAGTAHKQGRTPQAALVAYAQTLD